MGNQRGITIYKKDRKIQDINHKYNDSLTFKIDNELDLQIKVVSFLKKRYPNNIFTATLGEENI